MSIKHGILALLTQGPAYGLQLRNELHARTLRELPINVGQIYNTLERLVASGYVVQSDHTEDGLPLYELSIDGRMLAEEWLSIPAINRSSPWESMVFQIMLARSLPTVDSAPLLSAAREYWVRVNSEAQENYQPNLAHDLRTNANETVSRAALSWLDIVEQTPDSGSPISHARPPRGRPRGGSLD